MNLLLDRWTCTSTSVSKTLGFRRVRSLGDSFIETPCVEELRSIIRLSTAVRACVSYSCARPPIYSCNMAKLFEDLAANESVVEVFDFLVMSAQPPGSDPIT